MDRKNPLGEYLQGALAGKMIVSPAKVRECPRGDDVFPNDTLVQVVVPPAVTIGSTHEITVRVRNYKPGQARGEVTLHGEDLDRGTAYDFQAPFRVEPDQPGACIVFSWTVPRYPTKVKWSASIAFDGQMGIGMSGCTAATLVTRPMH